MTADDFRLGNLVNVYGKPAYFERIDEADFWLQYTTKGICRPYIEEIKPIPLTEQILKDSGFEEVKQYHNHQTCRIFHFKRKEETGIYVSISGEFRHIQYYLASGGNVEIPCHSTGFVHDLQNAYYQATGKNLKIVIK